MRAAKTTFRTPDPGRPPSAKDHPDWSKLLIDAVAKPGVISAAYSFFHEYSVGNQFLAMFECLRRGIAPGPIHTFAGWMAIGRHVKKGEKAITLCMPIQVKRKNMQLPGAEAVRVGDGAERQLTGPGGIVPDANGMMTVTVFTFKPHWFVLSQTDGADYVPTEIPDWSEQHALHSLAIDRVRFEHANGNCQGYASGRNVAISPIAALPHKTLFHEMAHVIIGHTEEGIRLDDHDLTPRSLREVEAECVALICCEALNLPGVEECRGYVQHWLGAESIPDRSAQRIFKAADQILRAGRAVEQETSAAAE